MRRYKKAAGCIAIVLCGLLPAACSNTAANAAQSAAPAALQAEYEIAGLQVIPAVVEKGADEMSDEELLEIYAGVYRQAGMAYQCRLFELDYNDVLYTKEGDRVAYYAITNYATREQLIRDYEALFTYDYCQSVIFANVFLRPYTLGGLLDVTWALLHEDEDGRLYMSNHGEGLVMNQRILSEQVIYKSRDKFKVKLEFEWVGESRHPYVVTLENQNGLWVLGSFYWYDIMEAALSLNADSDAKKEHLVRLLL